VTWHEVRLAAGSDPTAFYRAIPTGSIDLFHHFWDEPWWPGAYVVRVLGGDPDVLATYPGADHVVPWDVEPDERLFGDLWPYVAQFFWASSAISNSTDPKLTIKLVHCILNARGMSERDEARFAAGLLWNRLTIKLRWRLYLRRRWEQA
jgi:hypothetical protein